MRWNVLSLLAALVFFATPLKAEEPEWARLAKRLSGESAERQTEITQKLRRVPGLDQKLLAGLDDDRLKYLAYDVIAELRLISFFPQLTDRFVSDTSGFAIHAANRLAGATYQKQLIEAHLKALESDALSVSGRVAVIDTLGRLGVVVADGDVEAWLNHEAFEVRSAAVEYVRFLLLQHRRREKASLLASALSDSQPPLLRAQLVFLLSELPASLKGRLVSRLSASYCDGLSVEGDEVRKLCHRERGIR